MKIPKRCKVTILGDSIPKGIFTQDNKLQKVHENAVSLIAKHYALEINNLSSYGQTLSRLIKKGILNEYLNSLNKKDFNVAVISLGGNDADYNWGAVSKAPTKLHLPKTPPKDFEKLLNDTILMLKKKKVKVFLTNIPPIDSKRYFLQVISRQADKESVLTFLNGDIENIYRHQELYNSIITQCAIKNNCTLLDVRSKLLGKVNYLDYMSEDGIHPNQTGHKKIAKAIIEQLDAIK